jgi:hypothetical protein
LGESTWLQFEYIDFLVSELSKLDSLAIEKSYSEARVVLGKGGAAPEKAIPHRGLSPEDLTSFFRLLVRPFELKYGLNRFWSSFRKATMGFYISHRDAIVEDHADIPLMNFQLLSSVHMRLSTGALTTSIQGDSRLQWADSVFTLTTRGLLVSCEGSETRISVSDVITVGREIYSRQMMDASASVMAVDYTKNRPFETIMAAGPRDTVADMMKHLSVMVKEFRRLTSKELEILRLFNNIKPVDFIYSNVNSPREEIARAIKRLKELKLVDEYNVITSDGINVLHTQEISV